jgi:dCTP deaminase
VAEPWKEWIPGVLNRPQAKQLCDEGLFTIDPLLMNDALDNSSIDLSLSSEAFRMVRGSLKPDASHPYIWFLRDNQIAQQLKSEPDGTFNLLAKNTYVFRLNERLGRQLAEIDIYGQATAKSSVGRVDVLARLIVDGMDTYECFDPEGLKKQSGDMYLEITPITFSVNVKPGKSLSQLRLFYGNPRSVEIRGKELFRTIFRGSKHKGDGSLSVDLSNTTEGGLPVVAFCGEQSKSNTFIPLWKGDHAINPCDHWKFKESDKSKRLQVESEKFYILRSKERISLPRGVAVYCRASDETIGEMRIHYAGFVHPLFGCMRSDEKIGTPLIFEVRGHQVNVSLSDGERMANLTFYRMSQDSDDGTVTDYENQTLQLSKFFSKWPLRLRKVDNDGTVEAAK